MKFPDEFKLVNQDDDQSCVYACVAMLAQKSIAEIKLQAKKGLGTSGALSLFDEMKLIARNNFLPLRVSPDKQSEGLDDGVFFFTCPSLNITGGMHCVIVDLRNDELKVYDPQRGNTERLFYTEKNLRIIFAVQIFETAPYEEF